MAPRRTLLALCSVVSLLIVAAIFVVTEERASVNGMDETIGTIPWAFALSDREVEERGTPNEVTPDPSTVSRRESASDIPSVRLVVLERGTRRPLPGASVAVWADPTGDHDTLRYYGHWIGPDFSAFLTSHGVTLTADEEGQVDLSRCRRTLFVAARSDDLFGMTEIDPNATPPCELEIAPSHAVDVVVRDADGRPCAGVSVGLGACRDSDSFWADVTDESGRCRIHDFETVVDEGLVHAGDAVAVRLDFAAAPAVEQWIDPARPPSEPIVLVTPATGAVRIRLVDGAGRVLAIDGEVQIGVMDASVPASVRPFASSSQMRIALREGRALGEHVALDQRLWISADVDGTEDPSIEVDGPKRAGETVDVDLATDAGSVLIRGRALDANGAPVADTALSWANIFDDGREIVDEAGERFRTASDGRFAWTMKRDLDYYEPNLRRTCRLFEADDDSDHREAALSIPRTIESEAIDLGDVRLERTEPLVRGRVVDQDGRGVRGVELGTVVLAARDSSRRGADAFDPRLDVVSNRSACDRVRTSADGSFAFYGPCLDLRWGVRIHERGDEPERILPFTCASRSKPLEIVTHATGCVRGTALVDGDWNSDDFRMSFVRDGDETKPPIGAAWWMDGDRLRFRIDAPAPARGRVEFRGEDPPVPATFVVQGVDILPGIDSSPKALADVDLRGKLPRRAGCVPGMDAIDLEIVDELGRPIRSGIAWVWTDSDTPRAIGWVDGRVKITDQNAHCIEVWAPGRCFHVSSQPLESARIVLPPEIELEIALALPPELKDPAIALTSMVRFTPTADDPMSTHAFDGDVVIQFDRSGKAHVRASAAGSYGVEVTLTRRIGPATEDDDGTLQTVITHWFEVRNVGGVQTLTFEPDAEQRETASKELGLTKD